MSSEVAKAGHDGPLDYPNDAQFGKASPGKIGMWLFLGTDAMSFSGLLLALWNPSCSNDG